MPPSRGNPIQALSFWQTNNKSKESRRQKMLTHHYNWFLPTHPCTCKIRLLPVAACGLRPPRNHILRMIDTNVLQTKTRNIRGVRQSIPAHPGGHSHCPLYWLQLPYWPQVKAGSMQLKQGGHLPDEGWCFESDQIQKLCSIHTYQALNQRLITPKYYELTEPSTLSLSQLTGDSDVPLLDLREVRL